jgi:hypothetical protein
METFRLIGYVPQVENDKEATAGHLTDVLDIVLAAAEDGQSRLLTKRQNSPFRGAEEDLFDKIN